LTKINDSIIVIKTPDGIEIKALANGGNMGIMGLPLSDQRRYSLLNSKHRVMQTA